MTLPIVPDRWTHRDWSHDPVLGLASSVARALLRPATYLGVAREAASAVADAVMFPLGMMHAPLVDGVDGAGRSRTRPMILVHGYGHNKSAWLFLAGRLRQAGIDRVETFDYNPMADDIPTLGAALRHRVDALLCRTGADRVDVVGHSMGGVVCRWMIQECGGSDLVRTCVTVSTPHEGTLAAVLGPGRTARQLRPHSPVMRRLRRSLHPSDVRWIAYYSNIDALVIPATSGRLEGDGVKVENILIKDRGHLGILLSGRLADDILSRLRHPAGSTRPAA